MSKSVPRPAASPTASRSCTSRSCTSWSSWSNASWFRKTTGTERGRAPLEKRCPRPLRRDRLAADHLFDLAGELLQVERLRQEVDVAVAVEPLAERILGV